MNNYPSDVTFFVPAAIAALPLTIAEKIALVRIDENPLCRNADLARTIGMSVRGVKKMMQRLESAGYLQHFRKGRARRLLLRFHVEQGTAFPKMEDEEKDSIGALCSSSPPSSPVRLQQPSQVRPLEEQFEMTMSAIDEITHRRDFYPETVVRLLQPLIDRIKLDMDDGSVKEKVLEFLKVREGVFIAMALGSGLPRKVQRRLDQTISNATTEQLIKFGERVGMSGNLTGKAPLLLAGLEQTRIADES